MTTTIKNTNIENKNNLVIGVDVGLTNWITLSDGQVIDRPKFLSKSLKKIKTLQKVIKEKEGFHNKLKTSIQLAKLWRKVRLQTEDYCHKGNN
jgi:putative transposase